jgi:hypothetical protein
MDNKNTEAEVNQDQDQLQEELYAEITEHDVSAPIIVNRKDEE